jgi:dipeptidyl aminopeptidase/acylaminoacyl peptidase
MKLKLWISALSFISLAALAQTPSQKRPFTFEDMMKLKRVGAPVPSPDGKWVVFDCVDVDLEANTRISHLWIVPAKSGCAISIREVAPSSGSRIR